MHDPRLGRFFAVDPLAWKYSYNSPYAFSENRVIDCVELEGLEVDNKQRVNEAINIAPKLGMTYSEYLEKTSPFHYVNLNFHFPSDIIIDNTWQISKGKYTVTGGTTIMFNLKGEFEKMGVFQHYGVAFSFKKTLNPLLNEADNLIHFDDQISLGFVHNLHNASDYSGFFIGVGVSIDGVGVNASTWNTAWGDTKKETKDEEFVTSTTVTFSGKGIVEAVMSVHSAELSFNIDFYSDPNSKESVWQQFKDKSKGLWEQISKSLKYHGLDTTNAKETFDNAMKDVEERIKNDMNKAKSDDKDYPGKPHPWNKNE